MDTGRVADRLVSAAAAALVGRTVERDRLCAWVEDPSGPAVVFVHGAGGIGKTVLVRGALSGPSTLVVDAREVEPTAAGLLAALGSRLGVDRPSLEGVTAAMDAAALQALVIDSYERFAVLDGWLRNQLVPSLPSGTTAVVVGRNAPNLAWRTAPGWRQLVAELHVGPLREMDAADLVARRRLDPARAERALRFGRGHPLALELAVEALARHPDLAVHEGPPPEVVEELVDVLFDDLSDDVRAVVEAAALLRRVTLPLLAAVLNRTEAEVEPAWRAMKDLPFVRVQLDGLELNAVVQEVAATSFELRDPVRARSLRRRAAAVALARVEGAPGWAATADLLHLVQNPVVRNGFLPPPGLQHPVEAAADGDLAAIATIADRHIGAEETELLRCWWTHHRDGFSVARGAAGEVRAFNVLVEATAVAPPVLHRDPMARLVVDDLARRPLRSGGRALFHRQALTLERGREPCPELALMIVDLKRTYLELRPDLLRVYAVIAGGGRITPMMRALGFAPVDGRDVGPVRLELWGLDMPAGSVDAWIARHIEVETTRPPLASPAGPRLAPSAAVASLSAREREVLAALADGLTNQQLAERLFISERTANRHLSNILTKLGVRNRTAAARVAIEAGVAG